MAASARNTLKTLYQKLQKDYKTNTVLLPNDREILEHLVYAAFLENAPFSSAFQAFEVLEDYFIDWNELRVSTTAELVDILEMLPFPQRTSERIRQTLQWIFQTTYKFDLEEWRKKDAQAFRDFLTGIPFVTRFMTDYLVRNLFNQNVIPLDEGAMRVMRLLDLVDIDSENKEVVKGLDRVFSRQDAETFFILLHQLSADMMKDGFSKSIQKLLKSIDPESDQRSFIPLVESDDEKDPSQIAKKIAAKQTRHPVRFEIDEADLLDDSDDLDFIEGTDDSLEEPPVPFNTEETEEEFYVSKTEIKERITLTETKELKSKKKRDDKKEKSVKDAPAIGQKSEKKEKSKKDSAKPLNSKEKEKKTETPVTSSKTKAVSSKEDITVKTTNKTKKSLPPSDENRNTRPVKKIDDKKGVVKKDRPTRKPGTAAESQISKRRSGPPPEQTKISVIKQESSESALSDKKERVSKTKKLKQKKPR